MKEDVVYRIRAFHCFYMPKFRLLNRHYFNSSMSATESRALYEIYENEGCYALDIIKKMKIEKSYLSKILSRFEKMGYLYKKSSDKDKRFYHLYLTDEGKRYTEELIEISNKEIEKLVENLDETKRKELIDALDVVTKLLEE